MIICDICNISVSSINKHCNCGKLEQKNFAFIFKIFIKGKLCNMVYNFSTNYLWSSQNDLDLLISIPFDILFKNNIMPSNDKIIKIINSYKLL